jgi:multiple sugar transport system substrate-binding protein
MALPARAARRAGEERFAMARTWTRRDLVKAGGGLAATLPLARPLTTFAAPRAGGATSRQAAQNLEPAELNFFFGANAEEAKTRQKIIDAFMQKFPQIKIKAQVAKNDPVQEIQTQFAGGKGPDIMMSWELTYSGLADRNIFADLNDFIKEDADFQKVIETDSVPDLMDMFKYKDKQYVLPEQYTGVVIYYNKKLFKDADVQPPPADWTDKSWNWDAFLDTATKLTKKSGSRVTQFGFADAWWWPLSATVLGTGNGGQWFDRYVNPTKSTITDPKISAAIQWYADLANVHHVAPTAEQVATQAGADMFQGGRAAMALTGHWFYPAFSSQKDLDFDIAPLPVGPDGTTAKTDMGSTGLSVSAKTKFQKQAWEFVKFSCGPEGQKVIAESGLFVPVLKSVQKSPAFLDAHKAIERPQVFTDAIENSVQLPITPAWNELSAEWAREEDKVNRGKETAADAAKVLEPKIDGFLKKHSS